MNNKMKNRILYEVEWSYVETIDSYNFYHTEHRYFDTLEEKMAFVEEKCNQPNVYRVIETTIYT